MASRQEGSAATTGYEAELWAMADALRGSMDAAEYKHVVLGLIFLKYISDAFEERHAAVLAEWGGRGSGGSRRVHRREHLLGAAGGPLGAPEDPGETIDDRPDGRPGHDRDRARQPGAQGRAAQGLRAAGARQAAPRPAHRHGRQHPGRRRRGPLPGRARSRLRVLPLAVRQRRGQAGRRVLHTAVRRRAACRDAGALPGARLRPVLRLLRHVRAVGRVHSRPRRRQRQRWKRARRHLDLRPGVELHDMAAREDEPRHPRDRRADRPRRQFPQRSPPGPEGRLHPRQPALQRLGLGRRTAGRGQALAVRRTAEGRPRTSPRSPRPTTHGAAGKASSGTRTSPVSARARCWKRSPNMATC